MPEWIEDDARATREAKQRPKPNDAAPHHLRCCYYNAAGQRCRLSENHAAEHEPSAVVGRKS